MNQVNSTNQGRQLLAWAVVFGSFFLCVVLTITLPLSVNAYLQNATRGLNIMIQASQGTVGITSESGQQRAVFASGEALVVQPEAIILTDSTASAIMNVALPDAAEPLARLQMSSDTTLTLRQASTPRFAWSQATHWMNLDLQRGRVRVAVPEYVQRPLSLQFTAPQGSTLIDAPGQYSLEVNNEAFWVTVLESGRATIEGNGGAITLLPGQRGEVTLGGVPSGPLNPARNLLNNGDFSQGLRDWVTYAWYVDLAGQPGGVTEVRPMSNDQTLRFVRDGIGHADVQISQTINQDMFGYSSLQLQLTFNIVRHSLGVCGSVGSECPLFVRIAYIDEGGINRTWQQGFYAAGEIDDNLTPGECTTCAPIRQAHIRVPLNQFYYHEVELPEELARQGFLPPRFIQSIALVASGHTFEVEVSDVALIVEE
jgi:hypothetical protein